jgi:transposase-like protein
MENKLKSPIYKDGMLFCPYCNSPLLTIEETHLRFKCAVCQKPLGKLTMAVLKRMFDDFPKELAKEWLLEMREQRKSSSV